MYPGNRHRRIRGELYDTFIDSYVNAAVKLFPNALLQWEDFGPGIGRRILDKYRRQVSTFSDDLQGTGAIALAATVSAMRICGTLLVNQRIVVLGAGVAGIGVADLFRDVMIEAGLSPEDAARRFWCVDVDGLLTDDLVERLREDQAVYARPASEIRNWRRGGDSKRDGNSIGLREVIRQVQPTILVGTSGAASAFTEDIVRDMGRYAERPIIFPLSCPPSRAEATPADLIHWTDGRALIVTGSTYPPITYKGITHVIGQATNAMLYPGLALGAIVSRSRLISVGMLAAAANALSSLVAARLPGASLLPHTDDLRSVTVTVAVAVAEAALAEGLAAVKLPDIVQQVEDAIWQPEYRRIQAC
jgi:malate dehydrogenase (oxaloacetate-decarboxylating)